jgi:hypothetical protein
MYNLVPYNGDCYSVYEQAVARKQDSELRQRLASINEEIKAAYESYSNLFQQNKLEDIASADVFAANRDDLENLYSYKSKVVRELKNKIEKAQVNTIVSTCQNCTINSVNTLDHVLAISKFPEFSVNPLNLFPSCGECNGYKNTSFLKNENRRFINLYLDKLPQKQYLFINLSLDYSDDLIFEYTVENRERIDPDLFQIISNHYESLNLPVRMQRKSIQHFRELINQISVRKANLPIDIIKEEILLVAEKDQKMLGHNYFKSLFEIALVNNDEFMNIFE